MKKVFNLEDLAAAFIIPFGAFIVTIAVFGTLLANTSDELQNLKSDLVAKNYAEYVVIDNKTGKTEFKLK